MSGVYPHRCDTHPHGPYVFWVRQQRFDEFQYKLACFQRDVTEPRNPFMNIFKAMQSVEKPTAVSADAPKKSKREPRFGRVPKAGAFVLKPMAESPEEKKQTKFCPITLRDAQRNHDIQAFMAVVAADRDRLNKIDFHPHLVFELVRDNASCVEFLLSYLHGVSLKRRHDLFDCVISKNKSFKILKRCGVPAVWLRNGQVTEKQREYLWSIGYTEIVESESESSDAPLSQIPDSNDSDNEGDEGDEGEGSVSESDPFGIGQTDSHADEETEKTLEDRVPIIGHKDSPCIQQ